MAESNIKGMHVAILATDGFEQAELTEPKKILEEAGAITTILALREATSRACAITTKAKRLLWSRR